MKINVYIEDATKEELTRLLQAIGGDAKEPDKPIATKPKRDETTPRTNKYGIPAHLCSTDLKMYQRVWYRCKSKGMTYEQAIAKESVPTVSIAGKTESPPITIPTGSITVDALSSNAIVPGIKVKQIKPDSGRHISGTATVLARNSRGLVEVRDSSGKKHTIDARCLSICMEA